MSVPVIIPTTAPRFFESESVLTSPSLRQLALVDADTMWVSRDRGATWSNDGLFPSDVSPDGPGGNAPSAVGMGKAIASGVGNGDFTFNVVYYQDSEASYCRSGQVTDSGVNWSPTYDVCLQEVVSPQVGGAIFGTVSIPPEDGSDSPGIDSVIAVAQDVGGTGHVWYGTSSDNGLYASEGRPRQMSRTVHSPANARFKSMDWSHIGDGVSPSGRVITLYGLGQDSPGSLWLVSKEV